MGDNLKDKMIGALTWSSVNIGGIQLIQLIIGIILARILLPEDFGLIGVLYIFIGFSTVLIDGGFGQGLIRKQDVNNTDLSTIFFLNLAISIFLYLILFFSAPIIAHFFSQPELITLSRVIFLSVILYPFYQIQLVQLLKKFDYKSIAIINIISIGISGILAAILALKGYGAWSLVYQQLAFNFIKAITFPFFLKWLPELKFSFSTIKQLWRFTIPMLGQGILNVIFNHVYTIIIGRFHPMKQVGYFAQANKYSETVNVASQNIINAATFPILAKIHDDKGRSLRIYRKLITTVSMITFPLVAFLLAAAEPVIITLISEKWLFSVVLFQLLLAANLFAPMFTLNINILNAGGESKNTLKLELIKKTLITLSIIGSFSFGIEAMLVGFVAANIVAYMISMSYVKKSLNHYYRHQMLDLLSILLMALIIGAITYLINLTTLDYLWKLIAMGTLYLLLYVAGLRLFFKERFYEFLNEIKLKLKIS
jgi:O-antigen/teichoic acid export membrane protein